MLRWRAENLLDTKRIAGEVAELLEFGDVLALVGDLGAGKTTFVKYLVDALGGDIDAVTSPTFSLIDEHALPTGLFVHADLYRLADAQELQMTGLLEYFGANDCIVAVEWPSMGGDIRNMTTATLALTITGESREAVFLRKSAHS